MLRTSFVIDGKTKRLLDEFAENHAVNRSSAIRLILNDFFLNREAVK